MRWMIITILVLVANASSAQLVLRREALWTPAAITTEAWYDATDDGTITTTATGYVSQWDDKSTNDRHQYQSTGSLQLQAGTQTINGVPALYTNKDRMRALCPTGTFASSIQFTVVMQKTGADEADMPMTRTKNNLPAPVDRYNATYLVGGAGPYNFVSGATDLSSLTSPTLLSYGANTTKAYEWLDGTQVIYKNHSTTYRDLSTNLVVASRDDGGSKMIGRIGEIVVTAELSDDDRQKLEGYLAHKWGTEAELPADHPYKDVVPRVSGDQYIMLTINEQLLQQQ